MLFNSYAFIFLFLPVTFGVFFALGARSRAFAAGWLTFASLFFYAWWNPAYVGLLLVSIVFNYALGTWISRAHARGEAAAKKRLLVVAVAADLVLLGYYKYANFFLTNVNAVAGTQLSLGEIILPLGISFFTFTQIAFLVDAYQGKVREYNFVHYGLFVTYFPHLIAGPILHHAEMMPQFGQAATYRLQAENVAVGLTIFVIGLFKKVILADGIAVYVAPLFGLPASGVAPTFVEAWAAVLAYSLQLYFDFSGYSDMAIGLSRLFGVKLPLNFHSPYKAANIAELWNRWHMTLSRFLRDYLFVPLGGQRKSAVRRYYALFVTFLLCGLWHGAGWTYVVFGALHGAYLVIYQMWRLARRRGGRRHAAPTWWGIALGVLLTYACWLVGLAFFRSETLPGAFGLLAGMAGLNGFALPDSWEAHWGSAGDWLAAHGVAFTESRGMVTRGLLSWIAVLLAIVWLAPNTQQIMARYDPALGIPAGSRPARWLAWRPAAWAALATALALLAAVLNLQQASEFLYFQF
jgi:D-alanyl-lipoteichoic acid acyltransferase DltB (MBOAT superfamily)